MDCRPPGSFVQGILQARILEWVAISSSRGSSTSRGSSWCRFWTCISYIFAVCFGRQVLYHQHHLGSPILCIYQVLVPIPTSIWPNTQLIFHPDMWHTSLNPSRFSTSTKMRGLSLSLAAWNCSPNSQSTHGAPPVPTRHILSTMSLLREVSHP